MRVVLLTLILFTLSSPIFAQKGSSEISVSGGLSMPLGKFSSTNKSDSKAGYATTGFGLGIQYSYFLNSTATFEAMLIGNSNPINRKTLEEQYAKTNFNLLSSSITYYPNWMVEKANWRSASLLVGLGSQWIMPDESWRFKVKAMIGYIYMSSPEINAESKTDTSYTVFKQTSSDGRGLSFGFGGTIVKDLSKRFALGLDVFKLYSQTLTFEGVTASYASTTGGLNIPGLHSLGNSKGPIIVGSMTGPQKLDIDLFTIQLKFILKL